MSTGRESDNLKMKDKQNNGGSSHFILFPIINFKIIFLNNAATPEVKTFKPLIHSKFTYQYLFWAD